MAVYLSVILFVFFISPYAVKSYARADHGAIRKTNEVASLPVFVIVVILTAVAGFRHHVGTDFSTYEGLFEYYARVPLFKSFGVGEGLFWGTSGLIGRITGNVTFVFLFFALVITCCDIPTITKYTTNAQLSLFLYITTMQYFNTFNGIRQSVAAAIMFAAFPLLANKKWIKYFTVVAITFFVHNSVILIIPFAILANMDLKKGSTKLLYIAIFAVVFLFPGFVDSIFSVLTPDNYQHFLDKDSADDGVNIFRVLVALVPVIISWPFYNTLHAQTEDKRLFELLVNFSTINAILWVLALRSTVMARFCFYTSIYNILLIPHFLKLIQKNQRRIAMLIIMALFLLYMVMLLPVDSNLLPYRTVFGG